MISFGGYDYMAAAYLFFTVLFFSLYSLYVFKNSISNPPKGTTDDDIVQLVKKGDELKALKWYRKIHKCSPVAARSAINKLKVQ